LGLTGPFGSGSSTIREILGKAPFNFKTYCLSDIVKDTWSKWNGRDAKEATRKELQNTGNKLRKDHNDAAILARKTLELADKESQDKSLIFDSIRNVAEVEYFRQRFYDFYLIGVCCSESFRWERVRKDQYERFGLRYSDFKTDEERDQNEEGVFFGQQVALCMHEADLLIVNENQPMRDDRISVENILREKLQDYAGLFDGNLRPPFDHESFMSIAYDASLMSRCFKRQVGAVIVDENGTVISIGYNANPKTMKPCYEEFGDCYRWVHIDRQIGELTSCPFCGTKFDKTLAYPYRCPKCDKDIYRSMVRDRAMSKCTALHAEEMAIINAANRNLGGHSIYATTFPCFTCAQKILQTGIKNITYVESYPDLDSIALFRKAAETREVLLRKFEGVKARAYHRLFGPWRKHMEDEISKKRMSS